MRSFPSVLAAALHEEDKDAVRASASVFALMQKTQPSCSLERVHTEPPSKLKISSPLHKVGEAGGASDKVQTRKHSQVLTPHYLAKSHAVEAF